MLQHGSLMLNRCCINSCVLTLLASLQYIMYYKDCAHTHTHMHVRAYPEVLEVYFAPDGMATFQNSLKSLEPIWNRSL